MNCVGRSANRPGFALIEVIALGEVILDVARTRHERRGAKGTASGGS